MSCVRMYTYIYIYVYVHIRIFEGVSVTTVILATVCREGRLRAAGRYIVSAGLYGIRGIRGQAEMNSKSRIFQSEA